MREEDLLVHAAMAARAGPGAPSGATPRVYPRARGQLGARGDVELAVGRWSGGPRSSSRSGTAPARSRGWSCPSAAMRGDALLAERSAGCGSRSGRAAGARRRRRARRAPGRRRAVAPHAAASSTASRNGSRASARRPARRSAAPSSSRESASSSRAGEGRSTATDSSSSAIVARRSRVAAASPAARSAIPSGRGSPNAPRARDVLVGQRARLVGAAERREQARRRRSARWSRRACGCPRRPPSRPQRAQVARAPPRAARSRPRRGRGRWRVRDRGAAGQRVLRRGRGRATAAAAPVDVVLDEPDLDQRERARADHEARVLGGVLGVGLRLGEVAAPPPRAGAQVRGLHEARAASRGAAPSRASRVNALGGLHQRAREEQRERRDVDGGHARAGIVEQAERAQRASSRARVRAAAHRLAVGEAGDEQALAGRRAARRRRPRTGSPRRARARAAARLPCDAAPRVACSSSPSSRSVVRQRVDRAR